MSQSQQSENAESQNYTREPAVRATAHEINRAKYEFKNGDGERDPIYQLLPSGAGANRVLVAGTLVDIVDSSQEGDGSYLRAEVVAGSETLYISANQYQQEALAFLSNAKTPQYVIMSAKMDWYSTDDTGNVEDRNVSLKPEWISSTDGDRRDEVLLENAMATIERMDDTEDEDMQALKAHADEQYKNDEDFDRAEVREQAVGVLEELDEKYSGADADEAGAEKVAA